MQITIHRGTHQIGGIVTEINSGTTKIIIDVGANLPGTAAGTAVDVAEIAKDADAVLVTHYHGDHVGEFDAVSADVPIYMGTIAKEIMFALQDTIKSVDSTANPQRVAQFRTFDAGKQFTVGDIKITPFCVDHSAYDAYMFLLECGGKKILHTGDFRTHGAKGKGVAKVLKAYGLTNIDCLIIEGTMLSRSSEAPTTERQLQSEAAALLKNDNLFVLVSSTNIDSIASFYQATQAAGKLFVCDSFQRRIIDIVTQSRRSDFYKLNMAKIYWLDREEMKERMAQQGFCALVRTSESKNKDFRGLIKAFPSAKFVYSMWDGYLKAGTPAFNEQFANFVPPDAIHLHTSGHASIDAIKMVCQLTNPKMIIPMHSQRTDDFAALVGFANKVKVAADGENIVV
jgi:ribonuclease J